ncbi:MAG: DNA polymerase III subunit gamma/tau [Patescibacteria group bacterium]
MEKDYKQSLVFYRKYRPRTFGEFINQEPIKQTLQNALLLNKISHAYLFAGVRGTGKTSLARLYAKTINCLKPQKTKQGIEPCNQCEICEEINGGRAIDLVEIDAASNRGIDEIRNLKEGIKFNPVKSKYKVFIIDEAHMLTPQAVNALLKTLEEPPEHAIFVLATTEPDKLLPTILSRVQRFDFKRLSAADIAKKLQEIARQEKIEIEPAALTAIARSAEGSIRDAESIFSQVVAFSYDKKITLDEVEQLIGAIRFEKIKEFLGYLADNDLKNSVLFINNLQNQGYQLYEAIKLSASILEKILILKLDPKTKDFLSAEFNQEELETLQSLAEKFDSQKLRQLAYKFLTALPEIKRSVLPSLPIEIVIIETLT